MGTYDNILRDIQNTQVLLGNGQRQLKLLPKNQQGRLSSVYTAISEANKALKTAADWVRGGKSIDATRAKAKELAEEATKARKQADAAKGTKEEAAKARAATQAEEKAAGMAKSAKNLADGVGIIRSHLQAAVNKVQAAHQAAVNARLADPMQGERNMLDKGRAILKNAHDKIRPCPGRI